jgi:hypothetical protein
MKKVLGGSSISILFFAIAALHLPIQAKAAPLPPSTPCPSVQIASQALVVSNTCAQTLDIRVATKKGTADNTLASGATWQTGLAVDSSNSYKFWSCPELLYAVDTTTGAEATYGSINVRCQSKP